MRWPLLTVCLQACHFPPQASDFPVSPAGTSDSYAGHAIFQPHALPCELGKWTLRVRDLSPLLQLWGGKART
jgi:hypothetical protein